MLRVLDAAVGRAHFDLDFQLEVARRSAFPDQEGVRSDGLVGRALSDQDAVLDPPELRIAVPVLEQRRLGAAAESTAAAAGRRRLTGGSCRFRLFSLFRRGCRACGRTGVGARREALAVEQALEAGAILERDRRHDRAAASAAAATCGSARGRRLLALRCTRGRLRGPLRGLRPERRDGSHRDSRGQCHGQHPAAFD